MNYGSTKSAPSNVQPEIENVEEILASNPTRKYSFGVLAVMAVVGLVSFGVLLANGNIPSSLRGITQKASSFRDIMTSESIYAPLQFQDTTHYTLIPKFLAKYGLDGTAELSENDYNVSSSKGWMSVELFEGAACSGESYGVGGVVVGQCLNVYGYEDVDYERSLVFECSDDGSVILKTYNASDCSSDFTSKRLGTEGCKEPSDELYDEIYHSVKCSAAGALPLQGSFDLFKAYVGNKDVAIFEANPINTCITLIADHSFTFGHFNKEPNYYIYDSEDCSGQSSTETLTQDYTEFSDHETDFPMDAEVVYTWEYYDSRSN